MRPSPELKTGHRGGVVFRRPVRGLHNDHFDQRRLCAAGRADVVRRNRRRVKLRKRPLHGRHCRFDLSTPPSTIVQAGLSPSFFGVEATIQPAWRGLAGHRGFQDTSAPGLTATPSNATGVVDNGLQLINAGTVEVHTAGGFGHRHRGRQPHDGGKHHGQSRVVRAEASALRLDVVAAPPRSTMGLSTSRASSPPIAVNTERRNHQLHQQR